MKITVLKTSGNVYSANSYLITGTWNSLQDCNTLIDPGRDTTVFHSLDEAPGGVGQVKVNQIILTHSHYDHSELALAVKNKYNAKFFAFSAAIEGIDRTLVNGEILHFGDLDFEVIHTPGHSSDSICLFNKDTGVLFSGDTPLVINRPGGTYEGCYIEALEILCKIGVKIIYPGHGQAITEDCQGKLLNTLKNVRESMRTS